MLKKVKHNRSDEGNTEVVCVFTHHRHELLNHQRAVLANILLTLQREEERRQDHYKKKEKKGEKNKSHTLSFTPSIPQKQQAIAIKPPVRLDHFTAKQIYPC